MFAYCNNDPVNATDSTGEMRVLGAGGGFSYAAGGGSFYSGGSTVSQGIQSLTEGLAISTYLALNAVNAYNDLREDVIAMHHYSPGKKADQLRLREQIHENATIIKRIFRLIHMNLCLEV